MTKKITLFDAVRNFMGPLAAEGCRIISDGNKDMPVTIKFGPCTVEMTLESLKDLDRAFMLAHESKIRRDERKYKDALL